MINGSDSGRLYYIDNLKAFGVFLVILGHLLFKSDWQNLDKAICAFHMPMFFMISGMFLKSQSGGGDYVSSKFKRLIIPTLVFLCFSIPIGIMNGIKQEMPISQIFINSLYLKGQFIYNTPLWFFICLFEVFILARIINLANKGLLFRIGISLIAFLLGYITNFVIEIPFLGINKCLVSFGFFSIGSLIPIIRNKDVVENINQYILIVLLAVAYVVSGIYFNDKVSIYENKYGYYPLFVTSGVTGSLALICIFKCFFSHESIIPRIISNMSVFIIGTHAIFVTLFNICVDKMQIPSSFVDLGCIVAAIVILLLYLSVSSIILKYPILTGLKK